MYAGEDVFYKKGFFHEVASMEAERSQRSTFNVPLNKRYQLIRESGGRCVLCGATAKDGVKLHIDHIKPVSTNPELERDPSNWQVLCNDCNRGKSNNCDIDWRE